MSPLFSRLLVLLIEDSQDDAFFFRWTLKKSGCACEVVHAADGNAAIRHLENGLAGTDGARRPDLVFLDLKMPAFSGFEVLSWLRDQHLDPPLDVAVLSGSEHASDIHHAHTLGASTYHVKPLSPEQLRERIDACQHHRGKAGRATSAVGGTSVVPDPLA